MKRPAKAAAEIDRPGRPVTRFRCVVCGHLSAGRIPGRGRGDGTFRYPRRHQVDGQVCDGCFREAEWVELEGAP